MNFNPLRPCGRRQEVGMVNAQRKAHFNPLRPCGRRPGTRCGSEPIILYFNPLRPCGRRLFSHGLPSATQEFQSTPPVWAETRAVITKSMPVVDFNPLRPCGRRQQKKPFFRLLSISITTYFTEKSKRTRCKFSHLGYLFQYSLLILVRTSLYVDV